MGRAGDQAFGSVSSNGIRRGVEFREWRKCRVGSAVAVRGKHARQVNAHRRHIRRARIQIPKTMIDAQTVAADVSVSEVRDNASCHRERNFMSRRERCQVILKSLQIELRIRRRFIATSMRKDELSVNVVSERQNQRNEGILKWDGNAR